MSLLTGDAAFNDTGDFEDILAGVRFPDLAVARLHLPRAPALDLHKVVPAAVRSLVENARLPAGTRVAVTAGSRGITNISIILRLAVGTLREAGLEPFVVASMGSHGGGTPEGQTAVLAGLGITPATVGAPVQVTSEAVPLGVTPAGLPVFCDRAAAEAGAVLVINRVKPHTAFRGTIGSGLCKMLAVGLGKKEGAAVVHSFGPAGMENAIAEIARFMLARLPVIGGLAIVEDGYGRTARIEALPPGDWPVAEAAVYQEAVALLPHLPFHDVDVLIVDTIGKNISGTGMDTNVTGRWSGEEPRPGDLQACRVVALRLHPASHGNANGVGLADIVTKALAEAIDFRATYLNALTTTLIERVKLPMVMPTERLAIAAALKTCGNQGDDLRVVRIKNTREIELVAVSKPLLAVLMAEKAGEELLPATPPVFTDQGELVDPIEGW